MRKILLVAGLLIAFSLGVTAQDNPDARVKDMATTLNLRQAPSVASGVVGELTANTPLKLIGRSANNGWLKVETRDGRAGWVSAGYITLLKTLADVPVLNESVTAAAPAASAPAASSAPSGDTSVARVRLFGGTLRLRQEPGVSAAILAELTGGTALEILGRSEDGAWLNVTTPAGQSGWVSATYVTLGGAAPSVGAPSTSTGTTANLPPASSVTGTRNIYLRGQALGNRRNVFTRIGDSISVSEYSLDAIGRGIYNLGGFGHLQGIVDTFNGGFNSFTHVSQAAGVGWTAAYAIEPRCNGLTPVECELDSIKPSIALIQLGTNDIQYFSADQFAYNLTRIVDICIDKGVVPVLATIPHREGYDVSGFNSIIRNIAAARGVPLWDVQYALDGLPNRGLSGDGIHPSWPPAGYADSANFANPEALQSGYTARNLSALQILAAALAAMGN